jgi:hypothetical protein
MGVRQWLVGILGRGDVPDLDPDTLVELDTAALSDAPMIVAALQREEIDAFKRMFRIPPENLREVGQMFDRAREEADGWEPFAERLGVAFADNKAMLEDVLEGIAGARMVERTIVVTGEPAAAAAAGTFGAEVVEDPSDSGHPEAALLGRATNDELDLIEAWFAGGAQQIAPHHVERTGR